MKRFVLSAIGICLCILTNAQVTVSENGYSCFGMEVSQTDSILSKISVNTLGSAYSCASISFDAFKDQNGIVISSIPTSSFLTASTLCNVKVVDKISQAGTNYGIYSQTYHPSTSYSSGRSYGVCAFAGNSTSGWNYGLLGSLIGTQNGAGVFGTSVSWNNGVNVGGKYAGYFYGDVLSTGKVTASQFVTSSDYRLKEDIKTLDKGTLDQLMLINPVSFKYKQRDISSDTATVKMTYFEEGSDILSHLHYGVVAQELQEVFPELVYEGQDGYLAVNYQEFTALLISSIQDLNKKVEELTAIVNDYEKYSPAPDRNTTAQDQISISSTAVLGRTIPILSLKRL